MDLRLKSVPLTPQLHAYTVDHGSPLDPVARGLIGCTNELPHEVARMQIPPELGALLTLLTRLVDARFVVEIGAFTGYGTLCLARGLAPGGTVLTCDISQEWTAIARTAWAEAGVADRIDLRVAPAEDTLRALPHEPPIDLAFIDADKQNYIRYWEELVPRVRSGGLLVVDNVLYGGEVVTATPSENGAAVRRFNEHVRADDRVELVMLTLADGVTIARKR
ncbi:O-methyltransferase [Goodfellowiella coeruleoviolacea]|uniref:Caffeoyl-CoA O-methyltransferase n=1 Tax=Goodfellowiella coeruleoviolacea TaxID=334858 RepID=A0AAE3KLI1_9PSEU|nr:class I SAM-dependent methyltransferase [Goodfellowiella coeruleoviolacea]MCP2166568.1 caffeoyl-CoA O-methyltransferase [Goodfellowiella coeruleoviolacea]